MFVHYAEYIFYSIGLNKSDLNVIICLCDENSPHLGTGEFNFSRYSVFINERYRIKVQKHGDSDSREYYKPYFSSIFFKTFVHNIACYLT